MSLTKVSYSMITGAPTNVFDFMTPAQIASIQNGTAGSGIVAAIQAAFASSNHVIFPAGRYDLGNLGGSGVVRLFTLNGGGNSITLQTEGFVEFVCNTTGTAVTRIFEILDCDGLFVGTFKLNDTGYAGGSAGASLITLASNATTCVKNVFMEAIYVDGASAAVTVVGSVGDPRNESIYIGLISANNCQYVYNAQNSGDGVTIDRLFSTDCQAREFFVYGCKDVFANIYIKDHTAGGSAAVLIKAYDADTSDIRLNVHVTGTTTVADLVVFEHQNDTQTSIISDCNVNLVVDTTYAFQRFAFRSYNLAGVLQNTTTCKWLRITLTGNMGTGFVPVGGVRNDPVYANRPYEMIGIASTPAAYSTISLSPEILRLMRTQYPYMNNFIVSASEGDYITFYPATTAIVNTQIPYEINADDMGTYYKFTYTVIDDIRDVAAQKTTTAQYIVFLYESSGVVTVGGSTKIYEVKSTTDPAIISVTSSGGNGIIIGFTAVSGYTTTNYAYVKVLVERLSWLGR
jgi:hypothetical protein